MLGIKSIKMWVIVIDEIKITKAKGGKINNNVAEIAKRNVATRFMWMPGVRPVKVPIEIPIIRAINISSNIFKDN